MAILMVNPSTADATQDDQTIRKVIGFADRHLCQRVIVGNKFAFRATDINALRTAKDPIGPENDRHIEQILRDGDIHVVAWGSLNKLPEVYRNRWKDMVRIADRVGVRLRCIGLCGDGHPKHPLMTSYHTVMEYWTAPNGAMNESVP